MVQRYDYDTKIVDGWEENHDIFENDDGGYVKHEDYLALAAQINELNQQNFELTCYRVDVIRCLKTIAFEHNHKEVPLYQPLARRIMNSLAANQELKEVRAEAGRAGFVAGAEWWAKCELEDTLHLDEQSAADRWAESIWKGGLE